MNRAPVRSDDPQRRFVVGGFNQSQIDLTVLMDLACRGSDRFVHSLFGIRHEAQVEAGYRTRQQGHHRDGVPDLQPGGQRQRSTPGLPEHIRPTEPCG